MEPLELKTIVERSGGRWVGASPPPGLRIAELGTDSRSIANQSVFVALRGPKFDGHTYIEDARRRGVVASIVSRSRLHELPREWEPFIAVDDPLDSLERIARWNRERLSLKVVAITGSVGKTSTKEFLGTVLSGAFQVKAAPKSYNNRIGVASTLLSAGPRTEVLVVEMGTSAPGEISHLSRIVRPEKVVITEIGPAHLSGLRDIDGVIQAKAEIFDGLTQGGAAFVRHGIRGFDAFARRARGPLRTFGWGAGDFAVTDCQRVVLGRDPRENGGTAEYGYHFTLGGEENFLLPVPGRHNVLNAVAAIAVARDLGMRWDQIRSSLADCRLPPARLHVIREGGIVLVDDTYNANPASMEAAIAEWESLGVDASWQGAAAGGAALVAVLGDMLELGADSRRLHAELGRRLSRAAPRLVVTVGVESRGLGEACRGESSRGEVLHVPSIAEAGAHLKGSLRPGDCVLFKGSRRIGLDGLVTQLREWLRSTSAAAAPSGEEGLAT